MTKLQTYTERFFLPLSSAASCALTSSFAFDWMEMATPQYENRITTRECNAEGWTWDQVGWALGKNNYCRTLPIKGFQITGPAFTDWG